MTSLRAQSAAFDNLTNDIAELLRVNFSRLEDEQCVTAVIGALTIHCMGSRGFNGRSYWEALQKAFCLTVEEVARHARMSPEEREAHLGVINKELEEMFAHETDADDQSAAPLPR